MKKIMLIGKHAVGKTTLCQMLHNLSMDYKKTQAIELYDFAIDTPGEYIENRFYHKALIVTAADCDIVALVQQCADKEAYFPPGFGSIFPKPVVGIVTKCDLAKNEEDILQAETLLQNAGACQIFYISNQDKNSARGLIRMMEDDICEKKL